METTREIRAILMELGRRYAFRELASLVGRGTGGLEPVAVAQIQQLCAYGQRLLDLDAEDFANANAAEGANTDVSVAVRRPDVRVPEQLVRRGRLCYIRRSPEEPAVDALVSLLPAYRLLLEVIAIRWHRSESSALVATLHIASEYSFLLAWQPYLGHAGDPTRLHLDPDFTGPGSRWGQLDDPACRHPKPYASAARRALRVSGEPAAGWQSYLDRQHSAVSHALGYCATSCLAPCTVVTGRSAAEQADLNEAAKLAVAFGQSAIVRLRHAAPVGHGFGVPSPEEIEKTWQRSREGLAGRGGLATAVLAEDGFPLPGLASLFSAIASATLAPDTLIADTAAEIVAVLDPHPL